MLLDGRVGGQHEDLVLDKLVAQGLVASFVEEFVERRVDPGEVSAERGQGEGGGHA